MAAPFMDRLKEYYETVGRVLRGEADAGAIFPNASDKGIVRENSYVQFLSQHTPSKCNVFLGGFLFGHDGNESSQLDVIVTTDTAPRYDFHNKGSSGKSFAPVDGTLAVASIKSRLDKKELVDSLKGFASIPPTMSLDGKTSPLLTIKNYDDWPYKILFAYDAISLESIMGHLLEFYRLTPQIPFNRRPNLVHVAGKYAILRGGGDIEIFDKNTGVHTQVASDRFVKIDRSPDLASISFVVDSIQNHAVASTHINFNYSWILNRLLSMPQ